MINPYFSLNTIGYQSGQNLYENLVIESIQITGQNYFYIPRTVSSSVDQIFGEDVLSSFDKSVEIELALMDTQGYGGESEVLSKFGMEIRDTASFVISRKRYKETVVPIIGEDRNENIKWRPCEGDLIYAPFSKSLFEIKFVEDEFPGFYQLNKKYVWTLRCELVQLNNETFSTGVPEIDDLFNVNINRLNFSLLSEDGYHLLSEDGGHILAEDYEVSKPYDDNRGYGDQAAIKKEFLDIMEFSEKSPFGE